ncbi:hypothetical protein HMPREF1205_03693 [Bacteroides fragilis HMW 616]|nr:hypothetical protein HMPREF1205_03693 [Bacteroides fragilis HMW 616]EKA92097.1 hypothetical protein HMPREF1203_00213 [Bacteroides fragilis HMW 610]
MEILLFKDIDFQMVYSKIRFFTSWIDSSGEIGILAFLSTINEGLHFPYHQI